MSTVISRKIVPAATLAETLRTFRGLGKRIVQCHGCFDLVHPGHIRYLRAARALGDLLVVSLTGDARINKGPDRPYIPQELRAENLAALEFVDFVVIDPHETACEVLATLRPDIYVKGREYAASSDPRFLRERSVVEGYGGRVVFHSGDVVFSSTRLLETAQRDGDLERERLRVVCRRAGLTATELQRLLHAFSGLTVLILGDATVEEYVLCDSQQAAEDAPVMQLRKLGVRRYWGGAAALALQARALGAKAHLLCTVGEGADAVALGEACEQAGVALHALPQRGDLRSRSTFIADDAKLLRVEQGERLPLDAGTESALLERADGLLDGAQVLLLADHGGGVLSPAMGARAAQIGRQHGATSAGYTGPGGQLATLSGVDLLVASERRVRGAAPDQSAGLSSITWNVLAQLNATLALIQIHKRGVIGFDGRGNDGNSHDRRNAPERLKGDFIPTFATRFLDAAGAEEALLASAALTLAAGGSLTAATYVASAAGSVAFDRLGREDVSLADLLALLDTRQELVDTGAISQFQPRPPGAGNGETVGQRFIADEALLTR